MHLKTNILVCIAATLLWSVVLPAGEVKNTEKKADQKTEAKKKAGTKKNEKNNNKPKTNLPPTGVFSKYQLTKRMFRKTRGYFSKAVGGKLMRKYFEIYKHSFEPKVRGDYSPSKLLKYKIEKKIILLVVPKNYDAKPGWGILIHIMDNNAGLKDRTKLIPKGLLPILEKLKLIYVVPLGLSTNQPDVTRMGFCLDALATVMSEYPVDKGQIILSGTNSGCAIASLLLFNYPKLFTGLINQGWATFLSRVETRETFGRANLGIDEVREYWVSEAPGMNNSKHKKVLRCKPRIAFFNGYSRGDEAERIFCGAYTWAKYGYDYFMLDIPRAKSDVMPIEWMEKILTWIRTGKEPEGAPQPNYEKYDVKMPKKKKRK